MFRYSVKILFMILIPLFLYAQTETFSEYEVKSAFLEKFTRFIEWPADSKIYDKDKPFIICIIGESPIKSFVEKMFAKLKIKNKKVEVRFISKPGEIDGCDLLFIAQSEFERVDQIMSYTANRPILSIGDEIKFIKKGVLITLYVNNSRVNFEIDQDAVKNSGLYFSSFLINLSKPANGIGN